MIRPVPQPHQALDVVLVAVGSHGDVLPFLALGRALKSRGHGVTVCTNGLFEPQIRRQGLDFLEVGTAEEYLEVLEDPATFHPTRGLKVVAQLTSRIVRGIYDAIAERNVVGRTVTAGSSTAFAARIAQENLGVPMATINLQPAWFFSRYDPPALHPWLEHVKSSPPWMRRLAVAALDYKMSRTLGVPIGEFRRELGLPPIKRLSDWWFSPQSVVGLFPEWYAPRQPDWPRQFEYGDFPLFDEWNGADLSPEAAEFLDAGDPPLVFMSGSGMLHVQDFMTSAADACRRLKRRGMMLTVLAESTNPTSDAFRCFRYEPLSKLLPRAAALVHHGGVGTLSQALRAGTPQLVMPTAYDQPDNAIRLVRLGVARKIKSNRITGRDLAAALDELTQSREVAESCRTIAGRFETQASLEAACRAVERCATTSVVPA